MLWSWFVGGGSGDTLYTYMIRRLDFAKAQGLRGRGGYFHITMLILVMWALKGSRDLVSGVI